MSKFGATLEISLNIDYLHDYPLMGAAAVDHSYELEVIADVNYTSLEVGTINILDPLRGVRFSANVLSDKDQDRLRYYVKQQLEETAHDYLESLRENESNE